MTTGFASPPPQGSLNRRIVLLSIEILDSMGEGPRKHWPLALEVIQHFLWMISEDITPSNYRRRLSQSYIDRFPLHHGKGQGATVAGRPNAYLQFKCSYLTVKLDAASLTVQYQGHGRLKYDIEKIKASLQAYKVINGIISGSKVLRP